MNMRNLPWLGSLFLSSLLALGACGSSSSSGTGGTTGSLGGSTGSLGGAKGTATGGTTGAGGQAAGTGGTTGAGGASGACSALPPCLTFLANCVPSGTCVSQSSGSILSGGATINSCFSNGVKESDVSTIDLTTGSFMGVVTYSKGGATCFSESFAASGAGGASGGITSGTGTIKNASGATVATLTTNIDGTATVTCTGGGTYTLTDNTCMPGGGSSTTSDCTDGACP